MATLEKIRSKSVLLLIVIGVALLAFIVGDGLTNGRTLFGDPTTVAKIDGEKIDVTEFQKRLQEISNQNQNSQQKIDDQTLTRRVFEQYVIETLIDHAVEKLGITASSDQLRAALFENYQNQEVMAIFQALQQAGFAASSPQEVYDMIFSPKKYGIPEDQVKGLQSLWLQAENNASKQICERTYATLLQGAVKANELDMRAAYNEENVSSQVKIAFKPFGELDPKKYPVSDQELKEKYEEVKSKYKVIEPTKAVNFIAVQIAPSKKDIDACVSLAQQVATAMRANGLEGLDKFKGEGVASRNIVGREKDLKGVSRSFVVESPVDSVSIITQNASGFTIAKVLKKTQEVDSLQVNLVSVYGATLPKKVLAQLNGGMTADSIGKIYKDSVSVQKEMWLPLVSAQGRMQMSKEQIDTLLNAGSGYFMFDSQPQGAVIAQVLKKNAPVAVFEYAEVTYQLSPSAETIEQERGKFEKFLAENNDPKKFAANAQKAGYTSTPLLMSASTAAVERGSKMYYYPESRQVVKWAVLDASDGEVSGIFEANEGTRPYIYAAAVETSFENYIPYTVDNVRAEIEDMVRRSKAGDAMVKQYSAKGQTVEQVAQAMGVNVEQKSVEFANPMSVGDHGVVGRIVMTQKGKPVVVVKGKNGVYAYQVTAVVNNKLQYNAGSYAQKYMGTRQPDFLLMLRSNKEIVNNVLKLFGGKN